VRRAALLSGPPGIGKTTAARLVAEAAGYQVIEFNASDTRSAKSLREHVSTLLGNRTVNSFYGAAAHKPSRVALIMDEVDGMSSGDRSGSSQLVAMIQVTKVPVICICNDREHQKIKTLKSYCVDVPFERPAVNEIVHRIAPICRLENYGISNENISKLAVSCAGDLRQVLNTLQMWHTNEVDSGTRTAAEINTRLDRSKKEIDLGPFDVVAPLFNYSRHPLETQFRHYFVDSMMVPLLVQDNYLKVVPHQVACLASPAKEIGRLQRIAAAADAISASCELDQMIHSDQCWSLAPAHALTSTILPAFHVQGILHQRPFFPSWLARSGTKTKHKRLLGELAVHTSSHLTADREALALEYVPVLRKHIVNPLSEREKDGIPEALTRMDAYGLTRDDLENLNSLLEFKTIPDTVWKPIKTVVKTALTREFKKTHDEELVREIKPRGKRGATASSSSASSKRKRE